MKPAPNGPFYLPPTPKPKDRHKYNVFGFHKGFGKAFSAFYRDHDKHRQRKTEEMILASKCVVDERFL